MKFALSLILIYSTVAFSKPTSNVTNAVYSLPDEFFKSYDFPAVTFKDRVTICETFNSVHLQGSTVGANILGDGLTLCICKKTDGVEEENHLYFRLIKDKKKKRDLLLIFKQKKGNVVHLERVDVLQFDKNIETRWKAIDASSVIPKLTWNDLYSGITVEANKDIFTMKPAMELEFFDDGSIHAAVAIDYIEMELKEVSKYLSENEVYAKYILYNWSKSESKFISTIH